MDNILYIDTASMGCMIAIRLKKGSFFYKYDPASRQQSEQLMPMIDDLFTEAGLDIKDIDYISVCRGPGSFTGVRIGLAVAKMLGRVLHIPCYGFSSFDLALSRIRAPKDVYYGISIDSFRKEPFIQVFKNDKAVSEPLVANNDLFEAYDIQKIFLNDESDYFAPLNIEQEKIDRLNSHADIDNIFKQLALSGYRDISSVDPLYIRPADAQVSQRKEKTIAP